MFETQLWEITDTDFVAKGISEYVWNVIVDVYATHNLNVAANLALAIKWYARPGPSGLTVNDLVEWNLKHNPRFHWYKDEITKYLMLM